MTYIDFRRRCLRPNGDFDRIYYGHSARDYDGPGADQVVDVVDEFAHLSINGRRPGNPIEVEHGKQKFFFNKRIEVGPTVPFVRGPARAAIPIGEGGAVGLIKADQEGGGAGDGAAHARDYSEEACPGHIASADDPKVCDRCGVHINELRPDSDEESWT